MTLERIKFLGSAEVDDGQGGTVPGTQESQYSCFAEVKILKPSRPLEANQQSLRQGYVFRIWISKAFEPRVNTQIKYRDEVLTIQGYAYSDETKRKYDITALEGAAVSNPG